MEGRVMLSSRSVRHPHLGLLLTTAMLDMFLAGKCSYSSGRSEYRESSRLGTTTEVAALWDSACTASYTGPEKIGSGGQYHIPVPDHQQMDGQGMHM